MRNNRSAYALPRPISQLVGRGRVIAPSSVNLTWGQRPEEDTRLLYGASASAYQPGTQLIGAVGSGKGDSPEEAILKAVAEAFERFVSGLVRLDVRASAHSLDRLARQWLDPRSVAPLTAPQYERLPHLQPFTEGQTLEWVEGRFSTTGERILVPIDLVFWPCDTSRWNRKPIVDPSCNGTAAHTNERDAVAHALLELVERHALTLNWFERLAPPRIYANLVGEPWASRSEYWRKRGRHVEVLDLSSYGRGAVVVVVTIRSQEYPCLASGAGASIESFDQALTRAYREAEVYLQLCRRYPFSGPIRPEEVRTADEHAQLYAFPEHVRTLDWLHGGSQTRAIPRPDVTVDELLAELNPIVVSLAPLGDQIADVVIKLKRATRQLVSHAPLHAVRVICPDLAQMHFTYGAGYHSHRAVRGIAPESRDFPHYFA